jgi:hypothetical protein
MYCAEVVRMQEKVAALPSPKRLRAGRRKALPISPPALVLGIRMYVISDTVH